MEKIKLMLGRLTNNEEGQDMVEYALLAGFIAVAAGTVLPTISADISPSSRRCSLWLPTRPTPSPQTS